MSSHGLLFNKKLIEEVHKCDLIFNVAHPDHPNIAKTQQTWLGIASTLGDTVQKCRHRWQSLRRRYESEYSRMTSGIETREYKSNWKYIDSMSFLQDYMDQDQNRFEGLSDVSQRDLLCRACLCSLVNSSAEQSSESYNIFNTEHLAEKLRQCTNLLIVQWDEYPHSVCEPCYEKVLDFYNFQVMCRRSQEKLNAMLEKQTGVKCEMGKEEISDNSDCMVDYNDVNLVLTQGDMITTNPTTSEDMHLFDAIPENEIEEAYNADPLAACMNEDSVLEEKSEVENHQKVNQVFIGHLKCNGVIIKMITNDLKSPAEDIADNGTKVDKNELGETSDEEEGDDGKESSEHLSDKESSISEDFEASGEKEKPCSKVIIKCDICPKTFLVQHCLEAHQRRHQGLSGYPCTYANCERAYNRFTDWRRHLNDHNDIPHVFKCDIDNCDKVYKHYGTLNRHKREEHKCGKRINKNNQEQSHKNYICETCGKVSSSRATFRVHRLTHVDKSLWPFVCDVEGCTRTFPLKQKLNVHKKRHAGIKDYVCPHCDMRKTTRNELNIHINFHTFQKKYPCHICSKVFKSVGMVSTHINLVYEGKGRVAKDGAKVADFQCSFCDRKLSSLQNKMVHEFTHTGEEKPHKCDECGKSFGSSASLSLHMHVHLKGEKPYVCEECGERFKWPQRLKMHMKHHLEGNPFKCEECGKSFKWPGNLNSHKKLHVAGVTPYTCEECGQGFRWPGSYYAHRKKHMGKKVENAVMAEAKDETKANTIV